MLRLAAVAAVLRTAPGLDGKQLRELEFGGIEPPPMDLGRAEDEIGERDLEQRLHLVQRPVAARLGGIRQGAGGVEYGGVHGGLQLCGGAPT